MGLPYPGGPELARLAETGRPGAFRFSRPMTDRPGPGFQLLRPEDPGAAGLDRRPTSRDADARRHRPRLRGRGGRHAGDQVRARAGRQPADSTLVVAGGVGANLRLRARLQRAAPRARRPRLFPAPGVLHRQRRHDRLRRRAAPAGGPARGPRRARAPALGHGRLAGRYSARSRHGQGLHRGARDRLRDRHLRLGAQDPPAGACSTSRWHSTTASRRPATTSPTRSTTRRSASA